MRFFLLTAIAAVSLVAQISFAQLPPVAAPVNPALSGALSGSGGAAIGNNNAGQSAAGYIRSLTNSAQTKFANYMYYHGGADNRTYLRNADGITYSAVGDWYPETKYVPNGNGGYQALTSAQAREILAEANDAARAHSWKGSAGSDYTGDDDDATVARHDKAAQCIKEKMRQDGVSSVPVQDYPKYCAPCGISNQHECVGIFNEYEI